MTKTRKSTESKEVKNLRAVLAEKGIFAVYGGTRGRGHGFWLYRMGVENAKRLIAHFSENLFWDICDALEETPLITNDGVKSGNWAFTVFEDAVKYAEL